MPTRLSEICFPNTSEYPDHLALVGQRHWFTYADLHRQVSGLAAWLRSEGIGAGQVAGIAVRSFQADLLVKVALGRIGACIAMPLPPRVLKGEMPSGLDRVIVDPGTSIRPDARFLALPAQPITTEEADAGHRRDESDRPFSVVPPSAPSTVWPEAPMTQAVAWERLQAVSSGIEPGDRVAVCDVGDPSRTWLSFGTLARGATLLFVPETGLPLSLVRFGVQHLYLSSEVAARMVASPRVLPVAYPALRTVHILGPSPVPGLARRFGDKFAGDVRFMLEVPRLGPMGVSSASDLETTPLGVQQVLEDLSWRVEPSPTGAEGEIRAPPRLLVKHCLGEWHDTGLCALDDPVKGLMVTGRHGRVRRGGALWMDTRLVEQVLKTHEGVSDVMLFWSSGRSKEPQSTAVVVAERACAQSLLEYGREVLGELAPGRVIQVELAGRDSRREYLRHLLATLAGGDDPASISGVDSFPDMDE